MEPVCSRRLAAYSRRCSPESEKSANSISYCLKSASESALANETTKGNETVPGFETTMETIERVVLLTVTGWEALYSTELVVDPTDEVTVLVIPVKTSAGERDIPGRYNITMTIPDPPEGCWPNETLW